jgi:hypothetical protein
MKKVLIGILTVMFAGIVSAGSILDVSGNEHDRIWKEMRDNWHNLATGGSITNGLTIAAGGLTVTAGGISATAGDIAAAAGKVTSYTYPATVSGSNLVNVMMVQTGNGLWHGTWTTITQTFEKAYIATPVVTWSYVGVNATATGTPTVTIASNLFTIASPVTNFSWIAVGRVK